MDPTPYYAIDEILRTYTLDFTRKLKLNLVPVERIKNAIVQQKARKHVASPVLVSRLEIIFT
jgi:hypothetical protein